MTATSTLRRDRSIFRKFPCHSAMNVPIFSANGAPSDTRFAGSTGESGLPTAPDGLPLADAAAALLAGRDLLHTHHVLDQAGIRVGWSEWADVITSPAVGKAVADLAARCALQLAPLAEQLAVPRPGSPPGAGGEFTEAGRWLRKAAAAVRAAQRADPVSAGDWTLLFAIPASSVSFRDPPDRPAEGRADGRRT